MLKYFRIERILEDRLENDKLIGATIILSYNGLEVPNSQIVAMEINETHDCTLHFESFSMPVHHPAKVDWDKKEYIIWLQDAEELQRLDDYLKAEVEV